MAITHGKPADARGRWKRGVRRQGQELTVEAIYVSPVLVLPRKLWKICVWMWANTTLSQTGKLKESVHQSTITRTDTNGFIANDSDFGMELVNVHFV
jgi:hypothetical protein